MNLGESSTKYGTTARPNPTSPDACKVNFVRHKKKSSKSPSAINSDLPNFWPIATSCWKVWTFEARRCEIWVCIAKWICRALRAQVDTLSDQFQPKDTPCGTIIVEATLRCYHKIYDASIISWITSKCLTFFPKIETWVTSRQFSFKAWMQYFSYN